MFETAVSASSSNSHSSSTSSSATRRADFASHRRQRLAQQNRRGFLSGADAITSPLASMSEQTCKYKSGKCSNPRATKRNGQLHTLCSFHRMRQNEHQRKSDRKHRLINVTRRAKLGSFGLGADDGGSQSLHSILSLASAFPAGAPGGGGLLHLDVRLAHDQNTTDAFRNSQYAFAAGAAAGANAGGGSPLPGMGGAAPLNGRLPPISYLTGNLDGYRASSAIPALSRRS